MIHVGITVLEQKKETGQNLKIDFVRVKIMMKL